MKTVFETPATARRDWFVVDAAGKTLGRLASKIALHLRGKHKPSIVLNAEKVAVTGAKLRDKIYYHHTGAIGGIKSIALGKMLGEHPERAIEIAVKGMLPKGPLGRKMFKKLHVFAGGKHPHAAQQPKALELA
jgi:large subunit ribosomal protein L13